ncbi:MAG: alpha-2-macroglobulin family protein, partial [Elusimicrobiaceae bacterium]|nr:alpha-2-macroglobulin family protein [Elusimicrobiaceae bacterium]
YNLYVKVKPVIVSESGFKLNDEVASNIRVPKYPKELSVVGDGSIIPLSGSKNLNFVSLGINKFEVTLARIMPNQINHLVSQTYGNMKSPNFINRYDFNENNISEIFKKKITLNGDYKTLNYSSLDLKEYLKQGKGLFLVSAKSDYSTQDKRLIIISDIGVIYKNLENDSFKLYALSISEQKPLVNAKVEVLALNGTVIKTVYTNGEGMANIPNLSDFKADKYPVAFLVKTDNDFTYIPYNKEDRRVNYSRFDVYGNSASRDLEVFAWTDRGLYWPGEKVDFAFIAKNKTWTTTAGLPIKVKITDPRGTKVFEKDISLTAEGLTEMSYQLNENSLMGTYQIDIYSVNKDKYLDFLNSVSFKVDEYEEDKLKVSSQIQNKKVKGWFLTKESLGIQVSVQNMYGSPAQGNEVKASVNFIPTKFTFKDYKDYKFTDTLNENKSLISEETVPLTPQKTDVEGNTVFDIDLNRYSKGTYTMRFYADALEQENSKSVSTGVSAYVSPLEYIVGYKTDSNLSFLNKNSEVQIDFIALNNNLEKIDLKGLTLALKEQSYVSALTKQYDGVYRYQSVLQETEISKQKFDIAKKGASFKLPTDKPGHFSVTLYNDSGEALSKIEYFVAGQNNVSFNLERSSELVMYLDKQSFEPNEEVTINLITPYAGMGLITLEGDKVYASKWFKTNTTSSVQKIRIPNTVEGGAYLNISFVRALNSPEIFVSPFSYGVKYINVTPSQRTLDIELNTQELVQPGQKLNIQYKTSQPAKIILFGSSEGILQVARYKTPNPLGYFFRKKNLGVRTYQIFDLFLPDLGIINQVSAIGGDMMSESTKMALYQNEFKRNRLAPVTFWSKILNADSTAKTYTYEVPNYFNGNIRVMAVAVNNRAVGSISKSVNVKSPVILNASAPRMAAPKDIFQVGLRIANENEKLSKGNFSATISTSEGLKVLGDKTQTVTISNGEEKTIYFKVQASDNFGNNAITFKVKENSLKETYETSYDLSVRPASPYKATVDMGNALGNKFTIKDFSIRDMYAYRENRALNISQNPLVLFLSLETFLKNYPYGCTEQLTSQIFPRLAYAAAKGKEAKKQVQEELDTVTSKLSLRQTDNGSFSAWDDGFGDDELTMYVADMLLTANEFGYNIPNTLLTEAMERIKNYVSRIPYSDRQAELMAYGHYLLARNGESQGSYLASLEKYFETHKKAYKKNIEGAYLAAAYKMLQDNNKAQGLIKSYEPVDKYALYNDYDTSLTRNAKYMYLTAKYFPEKLNDKKQKELLRLIIRDIALNNYNTMSASYSMAALSEYAKHFNSTDTVFEVSYDNNNLKVKSGEISEVTNIPLNCKEFKVTASKEAPMGNFWFLKQEGYNKQPLKKYSNGLEIYQEFLNDKGETVNQIKAGEELTVKIKIKSLTGKPITNVAIVDMFAAPFMFVRGSLQGSYTFAEPMEDRLLIFGNYGSNTTTLTYKVKVVNAGEFIVPAVIAEAMYNSALSASTDEGKIIVEKR